MGFIEGSCKAKMRKRGRILWLNLLLYIYLRKNTARRALPR